MEEHTIVAFIGKFGHGLHDGFLCSVKVAVLHPSNSCPSFRSTAPSLPQTAEHILFVQFTV